MNSVKKNLGIYLCEGCRIGQSMDLDELSLFVNTDLQPAVCERHKAYCSPDGVKSMLASSTKAQLDGILIAGCGRGCKDEAFRLENSVAMERVNLREMVAWAMEKGEEDTLMAAKDYLRMGMAGLQQKSLVKPYILKEVSGEILVVGAGVAGLKAAIDGAAGGYLVHLVEKGSSLGGWSGKWKKQIPFDQPFDTLMNPLVGELIEQAEAHQNIKIYLDSQVEKVDGEPGSFEVRLKDGKNTKLRVGSILMATGWKPYDAKKKSLFGMGEVPGVITSVELERQVEEDGIGKLSSVLFIQCAGSRDEDHLPYCSSVCCGISLKQASYIRDSNPEAIVYIIYKDIRTPGFLEEFYKEVQDDPYIIFIKGEVEVVSTAAAGQIEVQLKDLLQNENISVTVQKVVLATGMVPNDTNELNLAYRLGEGLPELKYEFADSHFICFPYESRRTGIYTAGAIRAPMDIPSAMEDGSGAMMKAIQMIESARRGDAVHPRAGDQSYPELYLERCTDCKRCTEECPFGTYDETASGTPVVHPNRCRRCGICLGACPERVISFADFSITMISEMIKSIEVPDEFEEKPRVLVFVCENDALPALEMAVKKGLKINPYVRILPVRCLGSINRIWISDALSKGYDGILQIGCKPGDDYQCHFIQGSELNEQRSEIFEETLTSMMLEPERISTKFVDITDYHGIIEHIDEYMEEIDLVGPNPFKEM